MRLCSPWCAMAHWLLLLTGVVFDRAFGELPNPAHPVAWFGRSAARVGQLAPKTGRVRRFLFGAAMTLALTVAVVCLGRAAVDTATHLHPWAGTAVALFLFQSTFAQRRLEEVAGLMHDALLEATESAPLDLSKARDLLSHLCSRDPSNLDAEALSAATIESISENLSDSFVAPLFYYALFGLEGALAYRAVNTLDAMYGYRGRYEWLGKFPARLDDLLNIIPARISGALIVLAALLIRPHAQAVPRALRAAQTMVRDARRTESPNAGWPMAAAAGALSVQLAKPGHYTLGAHFPPPAPADIVRAVSLVRWAACMSFSATLGALLIQA